MKQVVLFSSLLFLTLHSGAQTEKAFVLTGTITGAADGTPVSLRSTEDNLILASDSVKKNKFTIKGTLEEPGLFWLAIGNEPPQYIYMENSKMNVVGKTGALQDIQVTGSSSHIDFLDFRNTFNPKVERLNSVITLINTTADGEKRDSIVQVYYAMMEEIGGAIDSYVNKHPSSYVSPFVLSVTSQFYDDPMLLENRFMKLDSMVRGSIEGQNLQAMINYNKIGAVGTKAVDFTQPDTSGTDISLSSFRGKYVLVDFWASWCRPCRDENPNVVANYNRFKDKNFTVLGVSLDRPGQKAAWVNAIKQDHLTWTHVSDLQFWNNAAAQLYRVQGIPFNILVSPDGTIVAKNLRGPDLENKLCELLGCN